MRAALSPSASEFLRKFIFRQAAIVLDEKKDYLLESRLSPLLDKQGLRSWDDLVERLSHAGGAGLRQQVVEALTTHETSFFRDWHPFVTLRDHVLPQLHAERSGAKALHIWSAAASSGQEIYSIAMLLREGGARWQGWSLRLLGTDISAEILARAKAGRYSQLEVNRGVPAPLLIRHFTNVGVEWHVKDELRSLVEFRLLNLIESWPALPPMDVVMLRNVLIYFDIPTRRRILDRVAQTMRHGGFLFLGGVESTLNMTGRFDEVHFGKTVVHRLVR